MYVSKSWRIRSSYSFAAAGSLGTKGLDGAKQVSACTDDATKTNHTIRTYLMFRDVDMMLAPLSSLEKSNSMRIDVLYEEVRQVTIL
jgi:hypothetical protein